MRGFFERTSKKLPGFYVNQMRKALGPLWDALPRNAISHDPNAYLNDPTAYAVVNRTARAAQPRALVA